MGKKKRKKIMPANSVSIPSPSCASPLSQLSTRTGFSTKQDISRSNEVATAAAKLGKKSGICTARDKCKMEMGHRFHKCVTCEEYIHIPCSVSKNPEEPMCPNCYETFE